MERIDAYLAPGAQDLAVVLGVSRRTIYAWRNGEAPEVQPSLAALDKLRQLVGIAQSWSALSTSPLAFLLRWPVDDTTLFELLAQPVWDMEAVGAVLRDLASVRAHQEERAQKYGHRHSADEVPWSEMTEEQRVAKRTRAWLAINTS